MDRIRVNPETRNLSNTEFTQTLNILSKRVGELNKSLVASHYNQRYLHTAL